MTDLRCDVCGFDNTTMDNAALTARIAAGAEGYVVALTHDVAVLRRRPEPNVWSVLEYAVHQREVIGFYRDRIEAIATSDNPQLTVYGFSAAAERDNYNDEEPAAVARQIDEATARVARQLAALDPGAWARTGRSSSPGAPPRDIRILASRLAHEYQHHLFDIEKGLAAVGS